MRRVPDQQDLPVAVALGLPGHVRELRQPDCLPHGQVHAEESGDAVARLGLIGTSWPHGRIPLAAADSWKLGRAVKTLLVAAMPSAFSVTAELMMCSTSPLERVSGAR
ncbi:hypothetical protein GCM10009647_082410 [Streptomyces sanglieri]|uniref:hypothetical protein n=1 Tax=Streptomyces sp. Wh19 TaxID=3076629 RepID=UPI002958C8F0|nr:hypothetical protein [Streptomyces sp. Wh19]MDV9193813.1 hypothetical protein [Streptomyces sp. Wh19]